MQRSTWFLGFGLLMCSAGCRSVGFTGMSSMSAPPKATLAGIVVSNAAETEYIFADLREPVIQGVALTVPLTSGEWVRSSQIVKVDVFQVYEGETYDYHAIIGPSNPGDVVYWRFTNSEPTIQVDRGWAFLWGRKVRAATNWVHASSDWTTIAVEVVSPTQQRFHLIRGAKGTVTCGGNTVHIPGQEKYVTIGSSCAISPMPNPIVGDPIVQPIIDRMKAAALAAGWDES